MAPTVICTPSGLPHWNCPPIGASWSAGDHNYPPYDYLDENGKPAGYNVELTRAIARVMDLDIEIRLGSWSNIVADLEQGEIDVVQGMFYSPGRDLKFDFTPPHTSNQYGGVVRRDTGHPPATREELAGRRWGA